MRYHHTGGQPIYAPNSYSGPAADERYAEPTWNTAGEIVRSAYTRRRDDDDFTQPGTLYREVLDEEARARMAGNIVGHASQGLDTDVKSRVLEYWRNVDADLGARVAKGLNGN